MDRVDRSLRSLYLQNKDDGEFEVIFVDYGSDLPIALKIRALIHKYPFVRYVYNDTRGMPWNRAHALNTGIRIATGDFIFAADIDLIFALDFIDTLRAIKSATVAFFFSVYLTPSSFKKWDSIYNHTNFVRSSNQGLGISLIPREYLIQIGGFDENFSFWGYEDNELYNRVASLRTLSVQFFNEKIIAYHQWHPFYYDNQKLFPKGWRNFMKEYFEASKSRAVPLDFNLHGLLYETDKRKTFSMLAHKETRFSNFKGGLNFVQYLLSHAFNKLSPGEYLCGQFIAESYKSYRNSTAVRFITRINAYLLRADWIPFIIRSKYEDLNSSTFQIRDILMYFVYDRKCEVADFAFQISPDELSIKFVLLKR